ncbi:ubiquitin carboxyl-terminal hydrolase 16-like [Chenopodium quinoa]|uniref:ubiquitin carboxyl-terminal hydrolase 16-like n=1 Tax=Chenopodium quinoa TaxID=63459 RepID=UPI000B78BD6F|nr:ubiquitin carboxyl-terminal hydrolase 16-like [Chenopodium quinoa]
MLFPGDLGFRVAVFFIFGVFPVGFFVLRRKWRIAVARQQEINRLLVLASEEAARAEIEANFGYNYTSSSVSIPVQRLCAVCFTPTPNRCARCKSVNYCSGKCQIVHWRLGHTDECRPSVNNSEFSDEEVSFVGDNQLYSDGDVPITVNGGIQYEEQVQTAKEKPGFTPPAYFPPDLSVKDDKNAVHHSSLGDELASQVELHGTSEVSQLHVSSSSDGMCISDSISDTDSIHDLNSDSCESCSTLDNLETVSSERKLEPIKTLEEESYSRVSSNGNVYASGEPKEEASGKLSGSSGLSINRSVKNLAKPSVATSGFWDGSLDYCRTKYMPSTDAKPSSGELGDFSSDICSKGPKTSTDTHPGISSTGKLVAEPALAEKGSGVPSKNLSSTFVGSKEPDARVKTMKNDKDLVKSVEVGTENLKGSALPFCVSEKANDLDRNSKVVLQSPMSKKAGLSPKSIIGPPSGMKEPIAPVIKPVKAAANVAMPSQVARLAPSASAGLKTSVLKVVEQFRAPKTVKQSDDVERKTEKAVFPYESFVKLYHWNKVELRPCGLINCGNSCYANVILQCLAFTPPLTAYLLQGLHSKTCAKKHWCFTCEFERLILKAKEGGSPLSPISILSQIQKIGSHLSNGREEDAHEFLRYAIDTMQSTCLQEAGVNAAGSLHEETTLLGLTFGGYLRSKIKCTRCRGKSEKQDRMMDLTVEIGGDIETLEDALRQFTGTEPLDGENKYHCGRCKSYEKAKKKLNILEAPNILTIALKRFQCGKFGKLNKTIRFPEILNLAPYMRGGSDKSPIYRLYGVVVHLDIMNSSFSGHYVCYVRNAQNKWYKIDDSTVKAVELERVLNKGAYMLFYSRISPRAPRSIRSAIVSRDLPSKIKIPDASQINVKSSASRQRDPPAHANRSPDIGYIYQDGTSISPVRNILDFDSSSDNSSLFSHSDEVSSSTDSNRESISADDFSEYLFGYNAFFRHSSDSDTSSSSSSSSSPQYSKHSPLSNSERYASALPGDNAHSVSLEDHSWAKAPHEASRAEDSGLVGGVPFLHSNSSSSISSSGQQVRKLVNISSREADAEKLGRANPLDNGKSGVYLRRSWRNRTD